MRSENNKVCTVQPLGVSENASFVIDIDVIDLGDLKADDVGSWQPTEERRKLIFVFHTLNH